MTTRIFITFLLTFSALIAGCTPAVMSLEPEQAKSVSPIGIFVIASSQIWDNADSLHKDFTITTAEMTLSSILKSKGYRPQFLNETIPSDSVFSKLPLSFYINEDEIAKRSKANGCSTSLIVYFAYTGKELTLSSGLNVYEMCSLYGWLIENDGASIIASSHSRLNSLPLFVSQLSQSEPGMNGHTVYRLFFKHILTKMFGALPGI